MDLKFAVELGNRGGYSVHANISLNLRVAKSRSRNLPPRNMSISASRSYTALLAAAALGAVELLASKRPLVALRVSRHNSEEQLAALVQYLAPQLGKITVLSGFISPGERQILDLLLQRQDTKIIKVSPYALPHDYSPGVALMPAIEAGHLAIIAKGNSPAEISRAACLDLNAAIAKIAAKAIYWRNGAAITPPI